NGSQFKRKNSLAPRQRAESQKRRPPFPNPLLQKGRRGSRRFIRPRRSNVTSPLKSNTNLGRRGSRPYQACKRELSVRKKSHPDLSPRGSPRRRGKVR